MGGSGGGSGERNHWSGRRHGPTLAVAVKTQLRQRQLPPFGKMHPAHVSGTGAVWVR